MDESQRENPVVKKIKSHDIEYIRNEIRKRRNLITTEEQKEKES